MCFANLSFSQTQVSFDAGEEWHSLWMNNDSCILYSVKENGLSNMKIKNIYTGETEEIPINNIGDCYFSKCCDVSPTIVFDGLENNNSPYVVYSYNLETEQVEIIIDIPFTGCFHPNMSFNLDKLVFIKAGTGICLYDLNYGTIDPLIDNTYENMHPSFSPDGNKILFTSNRSGNYDIWVYDIEEDTYENLTENPAWDDRAAWSSDGEFIVFQSDRAGNDDIWILRLENMSVEQVTSETYPEMSPAISNDGKKISYSANVDGNFDVYYVSNPLFVSTGKIPGNKSFSVRITRNNEIMIDLQDETEGSISVTMTDMNGRLVNSNKLEITQKSGSITLNTTSLPAGTYIITAESETNRITRKIILR